MCNNKNMICAGSEVLALADPYIQCVDVYNTNYNEVLMTLWFLRIKSCAADGQPHSNTSLRSRRQAQNSLNDGEKKKNRQEAERQQLAQIDFQRQPLLNLNSSQTC